MALGPTQTLNRNERQEYSRGGKGDRCVGLTTLPPSCADCLKVWEPQPPGSGPVQACNGIALLSNAIKKFRERNRRFTLKWIPMFVILKFVRVLSVCVKHNDWRGYCTRFGFNRRAEKNTLSCRQQFMFPPSVSDDTRHL
jgi:hypothetical protein